MLTASYAPAVAANPKGAYRKDWAESARVALNRFLSGETSNRPRKLTHPEAEELLRVSTAMISRVAAGKQQMQMGMAIRLAELTGVTLDDIMQRNGGQPGSAKPPADLEALLERAVAKGVQQYIDTSKGSRVTQIAPARRGK